MLIFTYCIDICIYITEHVYALYISFCLFYDNQPSVEANQTDGGLPELYFSPNLL